MKTHLDDAEITAWAAGELDSPDLERLEAHADACDACAERLSRGARVEMALHEVAAASRQERSTWPRWPIAAVALAAAALLVFRLGAPAPTVPAVRTTPSGIDVSVDCTASPALLACEEDASNRGLMTTTGAVPTYERPTCADCGRER